MTERTVTADKKYLLLPISGGRGWFPPADRLQTLSLWHKGALVEEYSLILDKNPRCWSRLYLDRYGGDELTIRLEGGDESLIALPELSDTLKDEDALYSERARPQAHFSPVHGFMNDPNGLFYYNGQYHYFSQLNPYGFGAANTHWLHAVSRDLMHWEELPYALLPDESGRMYSGCGVVDYENTSGLKIGEHPPILLFYTSAGSKSRRSRGRYFETAAAVSTDGGLTFEKYPGNPVVPHISFMNRDPKVVWSPEDSAWIMALFLDNDRYMLLSSKNLLDWEHEQVIEMKNTAECPDLFSLPLDGDPENRKWVLWGSPDNYMVGYFEDRKFVAETGCIQGPSHSRLTAGRLTVRASGGYAAQTYFGVPGDRVIQQSWVTTRLDGAPFSSCTGIPNEISLVSTPEGPRLRIYPAKEVENIYASSFSFKDRGLEELERIPREFTGECMDMRFGFSVETGKKIALSVRGVLIVYDPADEVLLLPNGAYSVGHGGGTFTLRVITDRCSVEIYAMDGAFNTVLDTVLDPAKTGIEVVMLDPSTAVDFELHRLDSIWHR